MWFSYLDWVLGVACLILSSSSFLLIILLVIWVMRMCVISFLLKIAYSHLLCNESHYPYFDEQEQNIASQIVHLVIAGNSVEISQGLLGGQVTALFELNAASSLLLLSLRDMFVSYLCIFSFLVVWFTFSDINKIPEHVYVLFLYVNHADINFQGSITVIWANQRTWCFINTGFICFINFLTRGFLCIFPFPCVVDFPFIAEVCVKVLDRWFHHTCFLITYFHLCSLQQHCLWISCQDPMILQTSHYLNRWGDNGIVSVSMRTSYACFCLLTSLCSLQPLNRCLFLGASVYNTFMSCTNPHQFELDDIQ